MSLYIELSLVDLAGDDKISCKRTFTHEEVELLRSNEVFDRAETFDFAVRALSEDFFSHMLVLGLPRALTKPDAAG